MAEPISDTMHSPEQKLSANATSSNAATRRDFLLLAGIATAGASLIRPAALFAAPGAAAPKSIAPKLFQFDPAMKMNCYRVPLGQIGRAPNLGNPRSLMHEIYAQSLAYVRESVGPDYLPKEWLRARCRGWMFRRPSKARQVRHLSARREQREPGGGEGLRPRLRQRRRSPRREAGRGVGDCRSRWRSRCGVPGRMV